MHETSFRLATSAESMSTTASKDTVVQEKIQEMEQIPINE